jgi:hypothetical protein
MVIAPRARVRRDIPSSCGYSLIAFGAGIASNDTRGSSSAAIASLLVVYHRAFRGCTRGWLGLIVPKSWARGLLTDAS